MVSVPFSEYFDSANFTFLPVNSSKIDIARMARGQVTSLGLSSLCMGPARAHPSM